MKVTQASSARCTWTHRTVDATISSASLPGGALKTRCNLGDLLAWICDRSESHRVPAVTFYMFSDTSQVVRNFVFLSVCQFLDSARDRRRERERSGSKPCSRVADPPPLQAVSFTQYVPYMGELFDARDFFYFSYGPYRSYFALDGCVSFLLAVVADSRKLFVDIAILWSLSTAWSLSAQPGATR